MIAIPNMSKPKMCGECDLWSNCFYPKNPYTEQDDYIAPDCPLIEIVTCEECKWSKTYYVKADNSTRLCCDNYSGLDKDVDPSDFCPYGERRTE